VSLQGTFDTLSVTELFGLLSTAGKTGALRLEAGEHDASFLVRAGRCCAVDDAAASAPVGSEVELAARLVEVGFTLARQPAGSFRFSDTDVAPSDLAVPFEPAVAEIAAMLEAWKDIESTIPSLDARLRIAPVLPAEQIVLRAEEWALLAGLQGTPSVRDLVAGGAEPLLAVCRRVKDLVDRGAIEVGAAPAPNERTPAQPPVAERPAAHRPVEPAAIEHPVDEPRQRNRSAFEAASASLLEATEPYAPEAAEPEPLESSEDPSADRGALLRLFSALKD
jgi:hypothetical protein